jgi:hypothetical protein
VKSVVRVHISRILLWVNIACVVLNAAVAWADVDLHHSPWANIACACSNLLLAIYFYSIIPKGSQ